MPSGLARSQQLYMMQRFLNIPATPSYVKTEGGMVLDRVVANLGGRTWWNTFTLRLRAQRAWNSQQFTEGRPQRILGDPSLYALGGRFRAGFSRHTVLKAFGELGSLKGLLGRFGSLRGADPNASNPNVTNTPTGITPSLSDELGDEIPRGRVTLRSTAVPYHVFTADWSHRERFQTAEGYEVGPSHVTASLASRGPQHVNYRVGVRQWLDDTIPAFELAPGGGRRAPPRRELVDGRLRREAAHGLARRRETAAGGQTSGWVCRAARQAVHHVRWDTRRALPYPDWQRRAGMEVGRGGVAAGVFRRNSRVLRVFPTTDV
jgi:hypothetical protein